MVFFKFKAYGIDTVSLPSLLLRPVVKHMAEIPATALAAHFSAAHSVARIFYKLNIFKIFRLGKRWPARVGVEFRIRRKKLRAAGSTGIHTLLFCMHIFARKGRLGVLLAHN